MNLQFLVPFIYPLAIVAFALSVWRPQFGIYYLTVVLPLQTLRYEIFSYPLGGSIVDIVLLGVLIGVVLHGKLRDVAAFPLRGTLLLIAIYSYLSIWYGSFLLGLAFPTSTLEPRLAVWKSWIEFGVLAALSFAAIRTKRQIETIIAIMCVTACALNWDFFQVMQNRDTSHYSWDLRYSGVMGYANANGLAAFEGMFILFLAGLWNRKLPALLKLLIPLTLVGCGYVLLFTFSRGAYLGVALGMIALCLMRRKFWVAVAVAALFAGTAMLPTAVSDRIAGTYSQSGGGEATFDSSAVDRMVLWQTAANLTIAHPVIGLGFGSFAYLHPYGFTDTHNLYLKLLVEQGAVGLFLLLLLLWRMFQQGYVLRREDDEWQRALGFAFAVCILGAAVINFFGDRWTYLQVDSYLWISLALVCRARRLSAEEPITIGARLPIAHSSPLQPAH